MRLVGLLTMLASALVAGQDAAVTLPSNYRVQFENAWVKVTAVRYAPREKLPAHSHTPNPSAYVYLNDGPPVKFRHVGGHNVVATRPATTAGTFRVYKGLQEVHEVENTGEVASEFLRVEMKTAVVDPDTLRGKFDRTTAPSTIVQLDHPQLAISRVWAQPASEVEITTTATPALLIALRDGGGFKAGEERWIEPRAAVRVRNTMGDSIDFLRFDFKTRPAGTRR